MATEYLNNKAFENLIVKFQQVKKELVRYRMFMEDIISTETRMLKRGKYQKPVSWANAQIQHDNVNSELQILQDQLAVAFYTLSENIVRYAKFNLIDSDDAIQEGVIVCFEKIDRFDPKKGKAFNYCSTIMLNGLRQLYRTSRNYNEFKKKYTDFLQLQLEKQLPIHNIKSNKNNK